MSATTEHQLQKEEPPVEEHPTESEKPHSEDKDDSDKTPHFEADSNYINEDVGEDEDGNEDEDEDEDEDDSHNSTREKLHYEDDSDIAEVEPMLKTYNQQVKESEGYDVDVFLTKVAMFGPFIPVEKDDEDTLHLDLTYECIQHAIKLYNEQKGVAPLEFVELVHATYRITGGTTYYIAFKARVPFGEQKVYQAKVYRQQLGLRPVEMVVYQFREKPVNGKPVKEYDLLRCAEELENIMA